jgi:hypothetical protein
MSNLSVEEIFDNMSLLTSAIKNKSLKSPLEILMWSYENDSGDCRAFARKYPELKKKARKLFKLYKNLMPKIIEIGSIMSEINKAADKECLKR